MKNKYNFAYDDGDRVEILDLKIKGNVDGINIDYGKHITYRVRYIYNGDLKQVWFTEKEITIVPPDEKKLGF
jgi:hypothetical protein